MPDPDSAARIREAAARILAQNRRTGHAAWNDRDYAYVVPSPRSYPFQWFWDSCFHAIALTHVNVAWAQEELETLLAGAQPSGFIPHQILWEKDRYPEAATRQSEDFGERYTSSSIQPPVLAVALERVYRASGDDEFLARCLPPTIRFYEWLAAERDPDEDDLIAIIQPDESGTDASPKFDPLMDYPRDNDDLVRWIDWLYRQYAPYRFHDRAILELDLFQVEELFTNVFYALGLQALARLAGSVRGTEGDRFAAWANRVERALVAKCYDGAAGGFFDLAGTDERPLRTMTITSLAPLALPTLEPAIVARLAGHLRDPASFALPFPVPSVSARESSFMPGNAHGFIWRGPTWLNANWLLVEGLRAHGLDDLRAAVVESSCALVERAGFREYYNPLTGEGYGSRDHSWSTLVVDMLDEPVER